MSSTLTPSTRQPGNTSGRLANLPVPIFSIVMGMAGTALVYLRAGQVLWHSLAAGFVLAVVTAILFAFLLVAYTVKTLRYPANVRDEFDSPVKLHFFPTISISFILLAVAFLPFARTLALVLWIVGTTGHLVLTLQTLSIWIQKEHFEINHIEPSWFIPVVGNILVPIAGVQLGHADISWFFFSIGIVFWIMLFTIFLYRIIFHHPVASQRLPTFFILIAPPAVAFLSYVRLAGGVDSFARVMYYFALFLFVLLVYLWRMFRNVQFSISWWAYSFPIAALTIATLVMSSTSHALWLTGLAWGFVVLLSILLLALLALTIRAFARHEI